MKFPMRRFIKVLAWVIVGLVGVVALALVGIYSVSGAKLKRTYHVVVQPEPVQATAAMITKGHHLAVSRGCADCHGADMGGHMVIDSPPMGKIYAPNLTRGQGGVVANFKDEDWLRAIRHGVGPDGRALFLMPSKEYAHFSTDDMGALVAYLKTLAPVDRANKPVEVGPVARLLLLTGTIKLSADVIDHPHLVPSAAIPGVTVDYGRYLAAGCTGCHGTDFHGGKIAEGPPDWPPAADLRPIAGAPTVGWTEADFIKALRTGHRPDGAELSPVMPRSFGNLSDMEMKALWTYLRSLKVEPVKQS
jgi:cytochrome c553